MRKKSFLINQRYVLFYFIQFSFRCFWILLKNLCKRSCDVDLAFIVLSSKMLFIFVFLFLGQKDLFQLLVFLVQGYLMFLLLFFVQNDLLLLLIPTLYKRFLRRVMIIFEMTIAIMKFLSMKIIQKLFIINMHSILSTSTLPLSMTSTICKIAQ